MDAPCTISRPLAPRRDLQALERLIAIAHWSRLQASPFRFGDVREAFTDYQGKSWEASDRMWSRDKRALAAAGVVFDHPGANEYTLVNARCARPLRFSAGETAAVRALVGSAVPRSPADTFDVEMGLRKLLPLGAPVADLLVTRPCGVQATGTEQVLRSALLLLALVGDASHSGIPVEIARRQVGVLDARRLREVATLLESMEVPDAAPPFDYLGLAVEGDHIVPVMAAWPVARLLLTPAEESAVRLAALDLGVSSDLGFLGRASARRASHHTHPTFQEIEALAA